MFTSLKESLINEAIEKKNTQESLLKNAFDLGLTSIDVKTKKPVVFDESRKQEVCSFTSGGKTLKFKLKSIDSSIIQNLDLKQLSDGGVENVVVTNGKKFETILYLRRGSTIPNNINIVPVNKGSDLLLSINCKANEIHKEVKSLKFEDNINLPYVCFRYVGFHLFDNEHFKTYEYLRDIIINKNIFLGYGIKVSGTGVLNLFTSYLDKNKNFEKIDDVFNNFDAYSGSIDFKILSNIPVNVPFRVGDYVMIIKLDGSIKGSIENDIKYWWDERYSKNPNFNIMKIYQDKYMFIA